MSPAAAAAAAAPANPHCPSDSSGVEPGDEAAVGARLWLVSACLTPYTCKGLAYGAILVSQL